MAGTGEAAGSSASNAGSWLPPFEVRLKICVEAGNWGEGQTADICKVLESAAAQFLGYFGDFSACTARVQPHQTDNSPQICYRKCSGDDFIVWLSAHDRYWAQYAYQFSHELCHLASDFERLRYASNKWFYEALCEMASLFTLKQMALAWKSNPPYANWSNFAPSLSGYAQRIIDCEKSRPPASMSLAEWFQSNKKVLKGDPYQRALNQVVAVWMLPYIEASPLHWKSICHLPDCRGEFEDVLSEWHALCPTELKAFPAHIAQQFSISIGEPTAR